MQPVSGVGLVSLALFSHFYLHVSWAAARPHDVPLRVAGSGQACTVARKCQKLQQACSTTVLQESLQPSEWMAVALAAAGTIGLGATTEEAPKSSAISVMRAVAVVSMLVIALGEVLLTICRCRRSAVATNQQHKLEAAVQISLTARIAGALSALRLARRQQRRARGAAPTPPRTTAYVFGLQAGACFGLSAACCRTGFLLAARQPLCVPAGLAASVGLTSSGFALQTCGLKDGNSLVVCLPEAPTCS